MTTPAPVFALHPTTMRRYGKVNDGQSVGCDSCLRTMLSTASIASTI